MPTSKKITDLVINKVPTKAILNKMKEQGLINYDEIYLVEEDDSANYLHLSGGIMTGAITTKGINLTLGTDYGTTLPSSPATNQLFFRTVGTNFVLDNVYPVGSIYMNVNSTNPKTLFGGTWVQIQGKFLLGMSSSYPAGSSGGEAKHTLTEAELPSIAPKLCVGTNTNEWLGYINTNASASNGLATIGYKSGNALTVPFGGNQSHNNMPPYLSVYIWKRTA